MRTSFVLPLVMLKCEVRYTLKCIGAALRFLDTHTEIPLLLIHP